ncbi:hypothetical protein BASA62_008516 [Batrachochytrium salamandrivorans]|nr:hypothetical protein BASA62_008516 [Batrachochytrium salamandrivorans]
MSAIPEHGIALPWTKEGGLCAGCSNTRHTPPPLRHFTQKRTSSPSICLDMGSLRTHSVASYAAALPQPAELSEKYSNSVDTTLASGLEARSYQPGLNSYKDSPTLISLERRDDSERSILGGIVGP